MTALLRARGSTSEMARQFAAEPDAGLEWPQWIWAGEAVPVVVLDDDRRRLTTMPWGLPTDAFIQPFSVRQPATVYPRDFSRTGGRLNDAASLSRCLIILEAFAYPVEQAGRYARGWIDLEGRSLVAWAGVCTGGRCAGVLVGANARIAPLSRAMPQLLDTEDQEGWLAGATLLSLGPGYPEDEYYLENLGERWSTGRLEPEAP